MARNTAGARETVKTVLLEELDNAFDKRSWHGANLMGALRGVRPDDAARRTAGRKSVWEQLLHAAYWKHRVLTKLAGPEPFPRKGSNWPAMPVDRSGRSWKADLRMLREIHARLRTAVASLDEARLYSKTRWLIHGAAAHDLYHAGQIKLLRRMRQAEPQPARK